MSVHIGEMSSEVTVLDGDLPLNDEQLNKLVQLVLLISDLLILIFCSFCSIL